MASFTGSAWVQRSVMTRRRVIDEIRKEDKAPTDEWADILLLHFNEIVGHPSKMDLIYYPEPGADTSSSGIARTIAKWHEANGLPGFKK
ncbi:bacteriocin immunity protein [Pseudomonas glycinae]|uniref:bacteriocin immunity protein n=2 Tax=Pseudomonas glycinae TaxID=1785145 RepID=UPI002B1E74A6|nr:bacteriocin immunity protein [Pseudomonas glycinae]